MAGYTRQSSYTDGDVIQADDSNLEFDQMLAAFNNSTGHSHDGTSAEGPVIGLIGDAGNTTPLNKLAVDTANDRLSFYVEVSSSSVEQLRVEDGVAYPVTNNDIDLGTSVFMFKDGYLAGTLESVSLKVTNIKANDGTAVGSIADSTGVFTIASAVITTADINGGTIDGTTVGSTTPAAGSFTTLSTTGNLTPGGTVDGRDVASDGTKLDGIETSADVTDTANVTAAGALMDSELTAIASVKALNQGVATTDSPTFNDLTLTDDLLLTGPNPTITLTDTDGADEATQIHNASGSTYLSSRNGASDGPIVFRGEGGGVITEYGRFDANGDFGLGEAFPDMNLHITDAVSAYVKLEDSGGVLGGAMSGGIRMFTGDDEQGQMGFFGTTSGLMRVKNLQGDVRIEADSNNAAASSHIGFTVDNAEAMRIDSSGNVGIGTTSPSEALSVTGSIAATGSVTAGDMFITGPSPLLRLTDNDAADKHATIQNNNGSTFIDGRNATANGDIIFRGAGGGVADEYARFDSSGHAIIPAGVTLGTTAGTYSAANTLDDYEEGTWTPTSGVGLSSVGATYTKIGNLVFVVFTFVFGASSSGSSVVISGLPFNVDRANLEGQTVAYGGNIGYTTIPSSTGQIRSASSGTSSLVFYKDGTSQLSYSDSSGKVLRGTLSYNTTS